MLFCEANGDCVEPNEAGLNACERGSEAAKPKEATQKPREESRPTKTKKIIEQEKYKTLSSMKSNGMHVTLKYLGEEDAIDEVIVFASSEEKGFGVFRLLCDDMRPDQILKLMGSIEKGDLDVSKLSGIGDIFESM